MRDRDAAPAEEGEEDEHAVLALRSLHDRVDIGPAVRDVLFLSAEPYALCRRDCRGLCPRCGQDLNAGDCDCPPDEVPEHGRGAAIRITGA